MRHNPYLIADEGNNCFGLHRVRISETPRSFLLNILKVPSICLGHLVGEKAN